MNTKKILAIVALVTLGGVASGLAQSSGQLAGEELLRALLEELRALRTTIQRNSAVEIRGQLLIERARMQNEIVRDLSRELEQRQMTGPMSDDEAIVDEAMESFEDRIRTETDSEKRRQLEREREQMKRRREMQKRYIEEARLRQQRLETRLSEERDKLQDLEKEINSLTRDIGK
ncbi:MAG TPA: hypothetical protein VGF48_22085 [Thermoanaerobaculia bacterium]|jgi:predicted ribosome quality control (RQC) complex YloA/Tae2 family protein